MKNVVILLFALVLITSCGGQKKQEEKEVRNVQLKGEEIPISAQVVSVADVYDALTSERVYKKAFSHEKAMEMILAGECGTFNPLLLECLQDIQGNIQVEMKRAAEQPMLVQNSYVGKMIETVQ